jgi:hypothetical protein
MEFIDDLLYVINDLNSKIFLHPSYDIEWVIWIIVGVAFCYVYFIMFKWMMNTIREIFFTKATK